MRIPEYEPCPFCGKSKEDLRINWKLDLVCGRPFQAWFVECACGARGPCTANAAVAVPAWNERAKKEGERSHD